MFPLHGVCVGCCVSGMDRAGEMSSFSSTEIGLKKSRFSFGLWQAGGQRLQYGGQLQYEFPLARQDRDGSLAMLCYRENVQPKAVFVYLLAPWCCVSHVCTSRRKMFKYPRRARARGTLRLDFV